MADPPRTGLQMYVGTPEEQAAVTQDYLHGLYGLGTGLAAQAVPPVIGGADPSDWKSYVPGIAPTIYGGITGLAELGMEHIAKPAIQWAERTNPVVAKVVPPIPDMPIRLPGSETAGQMSQSSIDAVRSLLPEYKPTTPDEQVGENIGTGIGVATGAALPSLGAGSLGSTVGGIVRGVSGPPAAIPIAGAVGGAAGALAPVVMPSKAEAATTQASPYAPVQDTPPTVSPYAPIPDQPKSSIQPNYAAAPGSDNDTGVPYWGWGLGILAGTAALWGAAKFGPSALNKTADAIAESFRSPSAPVEVPLPNDASGLSRRMAQSMQNPNAVMNEVARGIAPTPSAADAMIATNEAINNPANVNRRMEGLFRSGVEEGTGHQFPSQVDYREAVNNMTSGQQESAHLAAWYKSELNLRNENIKEGIAKGVIPTPANDASYRVSYPNIYTDDLRTAVTTAESDPVVKAWLAQNKSIQSAIVDSAEQRGMITKAQAERARNLYPDFMPTIDADGNYLHSWDDKIRTPGSGYSEPPAPAWEAMTKHFDRSIRDMQMNDWRRDYLFKLEAAQNANPSMPQVVARTPEGSSLRRNLTVQTSTGPASFDINNTTLYNSLRGGPQQAQVATGVANTIRKFVQNASTGPLGAAFGSPFVVKTVLRDLALIPAQAESGMWRGQLDKAFGTRLPYDPTFISGSANTMARDATTVVAKNMADILAGRDNAIGAPLRALAGDAKVDSWVQWMRHAVEQSNLASREAMGVGAGGNRSVLNLTNLTLGKGGTYRDPTANVVAPMLNRSVPLPNFLRGSMTEGVVRGAAGSAINLNSLVRELYGVIADAPHSYLHDLNMTNPAYTPRTLFRAVQDVTGNPGTMGTGRVTQWAAKTLPFYNTSIQAMAASMRAVRDRPIAMGSTVGAILATYALAEHLSALVSGKEHVDYLENQMANSPKARNTIIFHGPGTDPTDHTELPLPNEWQWLKPYVSGLVGHAIGTWNAHDDPDTLSRLTHALAGMFTAHVETDVAKQTGIGGVSAAVPVDIQPGAGVAVAALTGQTPRNIPDQIVSNAISGDPLLSNLSSGGGIAHKVPGQEGTDGVLLRADQGTLKAIASALGGAAGAAYDMAYNFHQRMKVDPAWAWSGAMADYKQQWQDNTRFMNSVWRNNLPTSTFGSLEERTNQMWKPVAQAAGANTDIRGEGFSRVSRGVPLVVTGDSPVPKDPQMRDLYTQMMMEGRYINKFIMPQERDIRAQIDNLKSAPFMPEERRILQNKLADQLYGVMVQKHQRLLDLNSQLSTRIGRHVDVGQNIDWQGTVDQFHP